MKLVGNFSGVNGASNGTCARVAPELRPREDKLDPYNFGNFIQMVFYCTQCFTVGKLYCSPRSALCFLVSFCFTNS
jgi:hypothetical protein